MPVFRCFIRGENFPGSLLGQAEPIGFFATRFVEAASAAEAEMVALDLLRQDPTFDAVGPEDRMEDARVYFEEIDEEPADFERGPGKGFSFFPMGT
ncbi:hypothetical protein [Lysobacter humi (ex Lee et al. 2017)]